MGHRRQLHHFLIICVAAALVGSPASQASARPGFLAVTAGPGDPDAVITDTVVGAHDKDERHSYGGQESKDQQITDQNNGSANASVKGKDIVFIAPPKKWEANTIYCSSGSLDTACSATIIDCRATGKSPRIIYMREEGTSEWFGPFSQCGEGYPPAPNTNDPTVPRTAPPPPTPTITQIREAFMSLPFAKPSVSMQPVGNKTLVDLPTFYAAEWPSEGGLKPGDVSKPVKLLSWTIEFKIASKDYRYDYGDGSTSGWTSSLGGTYPDGDITHTYKKTGTRTVKVDARLVGQYRVNGGAWRDLGAVADLEDEPTAELQVVGTRTRLTSG